MKKKQVYLSLIFIVGSLIALSVLVSPIKAENDGPPTQEEVWGIGNTYAKNYWDTMIFNNSNWEYPGINNMTTWLNNTWNMKWIKEGNFEMGMLAFMNKTMYDNGEEISYITPAQMWWQHAFKNNSEVMVAAMNSAWFMFKDNVVSDDYYTDGEEIAPFMYFGGNTAEIRNAGIYSEPKVDASALKRKVIGSKVEYSWSYNYSNIIFFSPYVNDSTGLLDWGFDWADPGTYLDGSTIIGNQTFIYYEYNITIDKTAGKAFMEQSYISGEIDTVLGRNSQGDDFTTAQIPEEFALCLGTHAVLMGKHDPVLNETEGIGEINATTYQTGIKTVETSLYGTHAFDFMFSQKPTYDIKNASTTGEEGTYPAKYACLDTTNDNFTDYISGMLPLVGDFAKLVVAYTINQTNRMTNGVSFEDAYDYFDTETDSAAFFITCYPQFGNYTGGRIDHDPTFTAFFDPDSGSAAISGDDDDDDDNGGAAAIPGFPVEFLAIVLICGTGFIYLFRKKWIKGR
ncbi:MAG: hypothetical protein GF383_05695 [Candidatus Lokiarchaeota archaeon]|nr:hypothetical protein [Candidatus Lokiarchaeota archaeon]MBD3339424.1 hypothetical protein [Candidatus Lokiarchaeota archaeon]